LISKRKEITKWLGSLFASVSKKLRKIVNGIEFDVFINCCMSSNDDIDWTFDVSVWELSSSISADSWKKQVI